MSSEGMSDPDADNLSDDLSDAANPSDAASPSTDDASASVDDATPSVGDAAPSSDDDAVWAPLANRTEADLGPDPLDTPLAASPPPPSPTHMPPPPSLPSAPAALPSAPAAIPSAPAGISSAPVASTPPLTTAPATPLEAAIFQVRRVIVGQNRMLERLMVCLLASGHCLLEGVPGIAKTLAAETLAKVVGGSFVRVQFTPDLLPADIVGTRIWRASTETFDIELGPIVANFVLADEINRAPAKVQSALLEAMAERQISIGGETYKLPQPFLVLATQNPIESEGVYPLPEAQRDRFLMKIVVDYPSPLEEVEIVQRMGVSAPVPEQVLSLDKLIELQDRTRNAFVDRNVVEYAVSLTMATRNPAAYGLNDLSELVSYGASPRASLGLVIGGKALAVLRGRDYVLPQDVFDVAPEVMRHRIVLSYEALARDLTADHIVAQILSTVPAPRIAPSQDRSAVS